MQIPQSQPGLHKFWVTLTGTDTPALNKQIPVMMQSTGGWSVPQTLQPSAFALELGKGWYGVPLTSAETGLPVWTQVIFDYECPGCDVVDDWLQIVPLPVTSPSVVNVTQTNTDSGDTLDVLNKILAKLGG